MRLQEGRRREEPKATPEEANTVTKGRKKRTEVRSTIPYTPRQRKEKIRKRHSKKHQRKTISHRGIPIPYRTRKTKEEHRNPHKASKERRRKTSEYEDTLPYTPRQRKEKNQEDTPKTEEERRGSVPSPTRNTDSYTEGKETPT